MITRRTTLAGLAAAPVLPILAKQSATLLDGLSTSELIYLTPIHSDGSESSCKSELWFYYEDSNIYVVTQSDAWRAEAVRKGLIKAKIWDGGSNRRLAIENKLHTVESAMTIAQLITDETKHAALVRKFGVKYSATGVEWDEWGPRWTNSLADGSRVMLRYTLIK